MAFTITDLENVAASIAKGELRVKLGDKEVEYRKMSELLTLYNFIQKQITPAVSPTQGRVYAQTGKGFK